MTVTTERVGETSRSLSCPAATPKSVFEQRTVSHDDDDLETMSYNVILDDDGRAWNSCLSMDLAQSMDDFEFLVDSEREASNSACTNERHDSDGQYESGFEVYESTLGSLESSDMSLDCSWKDGSAAVLRRRLNCGPHVDSEPELVRESPMDPRHCSLDSPLLFGTSVADFEFRVSDRSSSSQLLLEETDGPEPVVVFNKPDVLTTSTLALDVSIKQTLLSDDPQSLSFAVESCSAAKSDMLPTHKDSNTAISENNSTHGTKSLEHKQLECLKKADEGVSICCRDVNDDAYTYKFHVGPFGKTQISGGTPVPRSCSVDDDNIFVADIGAEEVVSVLADGSQQNFENILTCTNDLKMVVPMPIAIPTAKSTLRQKWGMTEKGSDIFPDRMRKKLVHRTVSEENFIDPSNTERLDQSYLSQKPRSATLNTFGWNSNAVRSVSVDFDSRSCAAVAASYKVTMPNQVSNGFQEISTVTSSSAKSNSPPSYEEALLHKDLRRSDLGEEERQQKRNALAKILYDKSVRKYAAESKARSLALQNQETHRKPPPLYETVSKAGQNENTTIVDADETTLESGDNESSLTKKISLPNKPPPPYIQVCSRQNAVKPSSSLAPPLAKLFSKTLPQTQPLAQPPSSLVTQQLLQVTLPVQPVVKVLPLAKPVASSEVPASGKPLDQSLAQTPTTDITKDPCITLGSIRGNADLSKDIGISSAAIALSASHAQNQLPLSDKPDGPIRKTKRPRQRHSEPKIVSKKSTIGTRVRRSKSDSCEILQRSCKCNENCFGRNKENEENIIGNRNLDKLEPIPAGSVFKGTGYFFQETDSIIGESRSDNFESIHHEFLLTKYKKNGQTSDDNNNDERLNGDHEEVARKSVGRRSSTVRDHSWHRALVEQYSDPAALVHRPVQATASTFGMENSMSERKKTSASNAENWVTFVHSGGPSVARVENGILRHNSLRALSSGSADFPTRQTNGNRLTIEKILSDRASRKSLDVASNSMAKGRHDETIVLKNVVRTFSNASRETPNRSVFPADSLNVSWSVANLRNLYSSEGVQSDNDTCALRRHRSVTKFPLNSVGNSSKR